jgi:hypothetical protein
VVFSKAIRATHIVEAIWRTAKPVNRTIRLYAYEIQLSPEVKDTEPPKSVEYANIALSENGEEHDFL